MSGAEARVLEVGVGSARSSCSLEVSARDTVQVLVPVQHCAHHGHVSGAPYKILPVPVQLSGRDLRLGVRYCSVPEL